MKRKIGVLFLVLLLILPVVGLNAASSPQLIDLGTATCSNQEYTYNTKSKSFDSVVINGTKVNLKNEGIDIDWSTLKCGGKSVSSINNAGTYTVTIKANSSSKRFKGAKTITIIVKKSNKAKINKSDRNKIQKKTYKASKNGKKKVNIKLKYQLINSKSSKNITYKLIGKNAKLFKISNKGVITVKKGAKVKSGKTYTVTVKTTRKADTNYLKKSPKALKVKIKISK